MKAILYTKYGPPDVLQLQEVEKPTPKDNEVLVRVHASSANALEWRRFTLPFPIVRLMGGGLRQPKNKSIGGDLAGRVEAVGANLCDQKDLAFLKELFESGKVVPVIDRCYPLGKVVDAMTYLLEGHPRGKVVITVAPKNENV